MKRINNKKGVSIMIGYVLLISAAIIFGIIAYQWLKTYVPREAFSCPHDVSIFIKDYSCANNQLNLTLKNNGKFSIAGYFIHISDKENKEIAIIDISQNISRGGSWAGGAVVFVQEGTNSMKPNDEVKSIFNLTGIDNIYLLEITPARFQEHNNKLRFISCGNEKIKEELSCSI